MKKKSEKGKTALVLWGATDLGPPHFSADILWRTGFKAPDPFFLVDILDEGDLVDFGKSYLLIGPLELERAKKEARVDEAVNLHAYKTKSKAPVDAVANFLKKHDVRKIIVPDTFPCGLKDKLAKAFEVVLASAPFYPKRAVKTDWEVTEIEKVQRAVEVAVKEATGFLKKCEITAHDGGRIYFHWQYITSEWLRKIIDDSLYRQGYLLTFT